MLTFQPSPDHVIFGPRAERDIVRLLRERGAMRALLVAREPHRSGADRVAKALGEHCAGIFTTELPQVPAEVADAAIRMATEVQADWLCAHGGGTAIGVAKSVARELHLPIAAIPTTFSGSERTDIWGEVRDGVKRTGRDPRVRPSLVAYDPDLVASLRPELAACSLLNALAHSIEALYATQCTPEAQRAAHASLEPLLAALRASPSPTAESLEQACRGAWLAGEALGGASMALHHKLAHVLGGSFGTAHAATHALLLPYTLHFNAPAAPATMQALCEAWRTADPPGFLYDLQRELGLPTSLRELGIGLDDVDGIVQQVLAKRYDNPRRYTGPELAELLVDAIHDRRPSTHSRRLAAAGSALAPHQGLSVTERGAPLDRAEAVVLAVHGRGASADRFLADLESHIGPHRSVCLLGIQARSNSWYPSGYRAPIEANQPGLDSGLSVLEATFQEARDAVGAERIVLVGFSQGACLCLTWLSQTSESPRQVLAFSGAHTPLARASFSACRETHLYMSVALEDPWVQRKDFEDSAETFRSAGATVTAELVPGSDHRIHPPDIRAICRSVSHALAGDRMNYQSGFGNTMHSEARPGAIDPRQASPRKVPYGLVAEQINGTGFTVQRAMNRRTWMYRLRPCIGGPLTRYEQAPPHFVGQFAEGIPSPQVRRFRPAKMPSSPTDFLHGLTTFAGAGDPTERRGVAIHLYAANADMERMALANLDGDLCVVPDRGRLHIRTELGRLEVSPGEICVLPRGIRFTVGLPDGEGRGWVAELFDGHLQLPERGLIGSNGLADERHFLFPVADFIDATEDWTMLQRQGGVLWRSTVRANPFDVVAWRGNYAPYKYDLMNFQSLGSVSWDHPDPSVLTLLTCPMDTHGRNALDVVVFRGRWDASENSFRPPFFHRNSAVEFNAVIKSDSANPAWAPGAVTWTPYLAAHGVSSRGYAEAIEDTTEAPVRMSDESLWVQFESTYPMKIMPWMVGGESEDTSFLDAFQDYRPGPSL